MSRTRKNPAREKSASKAILYFVRLASLFSMHNVTSVYSR